MIVVALPHAESRPWSAPAHATKFADMTEPGSTVMMLVVPSAYFVASSTAMPMAFGDEVRPPG